MTIKQFVRTRIHINYHERTHFELKFYVIDAKTFFPDLKSQFVSFFGYGNGGSKWQICSVIQQLVDCYIFIPAKKKPCHLHINLLWGNEICLLSQFDSISRVRLCGQFASNIHTQWTLHHLTNTEWNFILLSLIMPWVINILNSCICPWLCLLLPLALAHTFLRRCVLP